MRKKKIPLPWANDESHAQALKEKKVRDFWSLSRAWNEVDEMSVGDAITLAGNIIQDCNPALLVFSRVVKMQCNLIDFGCKSKMQKKLKLSGANNNGEKKATLL